MVIIGMDGVGHCISVQFSQSFILGAYGCNGAWSEAYLDYVSSKQGGVVEKESCARYTGKDGTCKRDEDCSYDSVIVEDFVQISGGDGEQMKALGILIFSLKQNYNFSSLLVYQAPVVAYFRVNIFVI